MLRRAAVEGLLSCRLTRATPSPLWGGRGGGREGKSLTLTPASRLPTPTPSPSPQGGGELPSRCAHSFIDVSNACHRVDTPRHRPILEEFRGVPALG